MRYVTFIFFIISILIFNNVSAQRSEVKKGWDEGYEAGYCEYNSKHSRIKPIFIVPICPIIVGAHTFDDGYKYGFIQGRKDFARKHSIDDDEIEDVPFYNSNKMDKGSFCDGWKDGYEVGYCYYNLKHSRIKPIFIVPICPIVSGINDYKDGYSYGFAKGKLDFAEKHQTTSLDSEDNKYKSFCDGWEEGYEAGYCYYNLKHHKFKPIFIVPICPIVSGINDYNEGYAYGFTRGKADFADKH